MLIHDDERETFTEVAAVLDLRRREPALRRGRQYLREISGNGIDFGVPRAFGGRLTTVVAWSRILADREVVCAFNTDPVAARTAWVTVDAGLNRAVAVYGYDHSSDPGAVGTTTPVESRNGRAIRVELPPAGFAVLSRR